MKHDGPATRQNTSTGYLPIISGFFLGYQSHVAMNDDLNVYGLKECNRGHPRIWTTLHIAITARTQGLASWSCRRQVRSVWADSRAYLQSQSEDFHDTKT